MHRLYLLIFMTVIGLFCYVWQHVQLVEIGKELTNREAYIQDLETRKRILSLKVSALSSFERIEAISKGQLGLNESYVAEMVYDQTPMAEPPLEPPLSFVS